jgi:hypothetical protein
MKVLFAMLLLIASACVIYFVSVSEPESHFFKNFSLQGIVKKTAYTSIDCSADAFDFEGEAIKRGDVKYRLIPVDCKIKEESDDKFDEGEFMKAVNVEIEKGIKASGASVTKNDAPSPRNIYFEYKSGKNIGKVMLTAERKTNQVSLRAELEESAK